MTEIAALKKIFENEKEKFLEDYFTFLRFPSIAADPEFKDGVLACAHWLSHYLKEIGLDVEIWETENAPVIFAQDLRAGPEAKTLLLYCHYDVQPVTPLEEWITPPFEPTVRDGEIFARGAADNKGQCFYTICALKTLLKLHGTLPVNLKFIIEGEEESGSSGLSKLLEKKKEALRADYLLIVDSGLVEADTPAITLGARGITTLQITVEESSHDLHSGMVGGMAYNPNKALVQMLGKLYDSEGRIAIAGFYDDIVEISPSDKKEISFDFDLECFEKTFGFKPTGMEKGVSPQEAGWLRPTLEINGMWGGYTGAGFKTVIPRQASAKISCRLVPNQTPEKISKLVSDFLIKNTPPGLKTTIEIFPGSGKGFRSHPHDHPAQVMAQSYSEVFEKPCKKILIGGSIPIAVQLSEAAQAQTVLVGVGLPGDHIHAPNERFDAERFEKGFLTICRGIELFG